MDFFLKLGNHPSVTFRTILPEQYPFAHITLVSADLMQFLTNDYYTCAVGCLLCMVIGCSFGFIYLVFV